MSRHSAPAHEPKAPLHLPTSTKMTGTHPVYKTKVPGQIQVLHEAELDDRFKCIPLKMGNCWPYLGWNDYNARAFIRVTENSLDMNYPLWVGPMECCRKDMVSVQMWDTNQVPYVRASCGTPYDSCGKENYGQTAATAVHPSCNNIIGGYLGLRTYVPGLKDADAFIAAANAAMAAKAPEGAATTEAPAAQRM